MALYISHKNGVKTFLKGLDLGSMFSNTGHVKMITCVYF